MREAINSPSDAIRRRWRLRIRYNQRQFEGVEAHLMREAIKSSSDEIRDTQRQSEGEEAYLMREAIKSPSDEIRDTQRQSEGEEAYLMREAIKSPSDAIRDNQRQSEGEEAYLMREAINSPSDAIRDNQRQSEEAYRETLRIREQDGVDAGDAEHTNELAGELLVDRAEQCLCRGRADRCLAFLVRLASFLVSRKP